MIVKDYSILAPQGMHARPAAHLLKLVKVYKSEIRLIKNDNEIQLNSMLNLLAFSLKWGDAVTVRIDGEDETEAAVAVENFFTQSILEF